MGKPASAWFSEREVSLPENEDLQQAPLFPLCAPEELDEGFISWIIHGGEQSEYRERFEGLEKLSAEEIATQTDLERMQKIRSERLVSASLPALARHAHRSVFYKVDLDSVAELYAKNPQLNLPEVPDLEHDMIDYIHHQMFCPRSPVRLDLAGGWTDTPPYCFLHGGHVVNLAVELNGQPPIQVFARVGAEPGITLRSIDLGISQQLSR